MLSPATGVACSSATGVDVATGVSCGVLSLSSTILSSITSSLTETSGPVKAVGLGAVDEGVETSLTVAMVLVVWCPSSEVAAGGGDIALVEGEIAGVGGVDVKPFCQHLARNSGSTEPPYLVATDSQKQAR